MRTKLGLALLALAPSLFAADFTATFLHVNDTHDRIEPTTIQGKPYGGMTRLATLIAQHRRSDPNPIVLHAGDAFQGTFYFNVYDGLADLAFLNALNLDAMTIGNHEFDIGPAALGAFARNANRAEPNTLRRRVFEEYGIEGANPSNYEVDYLVTPALGGADDIRNLWQQPYSAVWNAQVKDRLEDRLRELVCKGQVDLTTAQRDISADWIGEYKKYFHAEIPLETVRQ